MAAERAAVGKPMTETGRLGRFSLVGGVGFLCDGGLLTLLVQFLGWSPYPARALSFLLAVTCTWLLNRHFAFRDRGAAGGQGWRQYLQYLGAQIVGSLANMAVFVFLIWQWPRLQAVVVLPLPVVGVAGMILNYLLLDRWVFKAGAKRADLE